MIYYDHENIERAEDRHKTNSRYMIDIKNIRQGKHRNVGLRKLSPTYT